MIRSSFRGLDDELLFIYMTLNILTSASTMHRIFIFSLSVLNQDKG